MKEHIQQKIISLCGSQTELARRLGKNSQTVAGEIASILDGIPLSVQRRFPELENRHIDFLKKDIIKAMNKAAALDEMIPGLLSEYIEQSG